MVRKVVFVNRDAVAGHALYTSSLSDAMLEVAGQATEVEIITVRGPIEGFVNARARIVPLLRPMATAGASSGKASWLWDRILGFAQEAVAVRQYVGSNPGVVLNMQSWSPLCSGSVLAGIRRRTALLTATVHNVHEHSAISERRERVRRNQFESCDLLHLHSKSNEIALRELLGKNMPPAVVAPHGIWQTETTPIDRTSRHTGPLRILFFGAIRKNKGLTTLLEATRNLDVSLVIAGKPLDRDYFDNEVVPALDLPGTYHVDFRPNFVPDDQVAGLFADADVCALPYEGFEAQSGVLAHAIAYGVPIITSDSGAMKEIVDSYGIGWVYPQRDVNALRNIVAEVSGADSFPTQWSGMAIARSSLSWDQTAKTLLNSYEKYVR